METIVIDPIFFRNAKYSPPGRLVHRRISRHREDHPVMFAAKHDRKAIQENKLRFVRLHDLLP